MSSPPYVSVRGVTKSFGSHQALGGVSLDVDRGEFVCLLGPSGCGKTTLLRILAGLEAPDRGGVWLQDREVTGLPPGERGIGMVFQSYALFPNLSAAENIAYGLKGRVPKKDIAERVREALELIGLPSAASRYPSELSGGQQQRVALARAVVTRPQLLLLDEPLSALDAKVRQKLRLELRSLQEELGLTTIMVTHDQEEALTMADRIILMNEARIVQAGTPQEVYERPASPFTADFIGAVNFFPAARFRGGPDRGGLLAIRPEHIRIVGPGERTETAPIRCRVRHVEFRGPFYRAAVQPLDDAYASTEGLITVDIPAPQADLLRLAKDSLLSVHLPQERLIAFDGRVPLPGSNAS
ncbi:iron(III) transport system ATP-binding protein [Paenibacillus mucilaginosus]|uniref:ABC transporter ATP-binding protein n=1 Tax=Paenibacillus mucilaginosus TaxID=61624 RepID=UPI003D206B0C